MTTRFQTQIYLINQPISSIPSTRLPSNGEALGFFFHLYKMEKNSFKDACANVVQEVILVWNRAKIPTTRKDNAITKFKKLYNEWLNLFKHKDRQSDLHRQQECDFRTKMANLFDIAAADAMTKIKSEEDRQFLLAQREAGRRGCMTSIDVHSLQKEKRKRERSEKQRLYKEKVARRQLNDTSVLVSLSDSEKDITESSEDEFKIQIKNKKKQVSEKKLKPVITPELAAVLDRTKISDRQAAFIIGTTAKSLGVDIDSLACSRSTIKLHREKCRQEMANFIKESFSPSCKLTVHWDGKLMFDLTERKHVDRLPILVSGEGEEKLLMIQKLSSSTGEMQAKAIFDCLNDKDWNIHRNVVAMCFDTTSSNTGNVNGACVLLEQKLEKNLFWLACRHHIFEIVAGAAFQAAIPTVTSGPDVRLFVRFRSYWPKIDRSAYITANSSIILRITEKKRDDIVDFCQGLLQSKHVRDDYRELLELSVIFLGKAPIRGIRFMAPGATSHARLMAKLIYSLKMFMFSKQFDLSDREKRGLEEINIFTVTIYIKSWFTAPLASQSPNNDLQLIKDLIQYDNPDIAKATVKKMLGHLWYLSDELVGLCLFNRNVSIETKRKVVDAMIHGPSPGVRVVRPQINQCDFQNLQLHDLANRNTMKIFKEFGVKEFWETDVTVWDQSKSYLEAKQLFESLRVTNDTAERGIALIQELNRRITKDEDELQFLLQVISEHRKAYPDCSKKTLREMKPNFTH